MRRVLRAVFEGVFNVLLVFALVLGGAWYVFIHLPEERRRVEDPGYAAEVFSDLVPVAEILESRRWHPRDADDWDCTYAIVKPATNATAKPPTRSGPETDWQLAFGGDWFPTPGPPLGDTTRDALGACADRWSAEVRSSVLAAASSPGGWIARDAVGETVYLYAPRQGIAARVRFGD